MKLDSQETLDLLALGTIPGIGLATQWKLLRSFPNLRDLFDADREQLMALAYLQSKQIDSILAFDDFKKCEDQIARMQSLGVTLLRYDDEQFPQQLQHIATPPILLFCRGNTELLSVKRSIGVVGSRRMSRYGNRVISAFVPEWTRAGWVVVSGMAFGVDCCAHNASIDAGGKTIAVQAQGVDRGYPTGNDSTYRSILSHDGLIVSEFFSLKAEGGEKFLFPRRNRIISGLSHAVVVIEANTKSGALITARFAMEQGRDVYAVPGDVFSAVSAGCHALIRDGAEPLTSAADVRFDQHDFQPERSDLNHKISTDSFESPLEASIYRLCHQDPHSIDMLIEAINEQPSFVSATVTKMQILGRLTEVDGKRFISNSLA